MSFEFEPADVDRKTAWYVRFCGEPLGVVRLASRMQVSASWGSRAAVRSRRRIYEIRPHGSSVWTRAQASNLADASRELVALSDRQR